MLSERIQSRLLELGELKELFYKDRLKAALGTHQKAEALMVVGKTPAEQGGPRWGEDAKGHEATLRLPDLPTLLQKHVHVFNSPHILEVSLERIHPDQAV